MKHPLRTSILLWLVSLLVLALTYVLPNFGISMWIFGPLLGWLLTFGLPTTIAAHGLASIWTGLPLGFFFGAVALLALVFHLLATLLLLRLRLGRQLSRENRL